MIRRIGLTEGQAYTAVIALVVAIVLAATGIPSVLGTRTVSAAASNPLVPRPDATAATSSPPSASATPVAPTAAIAAQRPSRPLASPSSPTGAPGLPPSITASPSDVTPALLAISVFARIDAPGVPGGLAIAADGTVYVTTDNGTARGDRGPSHVFAFDPKGARIADRAIDGQPDGHVNGLTGAAVDPATGELAVLEPDTGRVIGIDMASGAQRVIVTIPDLPACLVSLGASPCQQGAEDRKPFLAAATYDSAGNLFVTDPSQDTVWRFHAGDTLPQVWHQTPFFSGGDGPYGLALDDGAVELAVGTTFDPAAPTSGGLYRVAINADGSAGAMTLVASFPRGDEPGALALGNSGAAYVVLRGPGAIVAITPGGKVSWQIDPPGDGSVPLDVPSGLALVAGRLLVTNEGAGKDAAHWAVLAVSVNDGTRQ